MRMALGGPAGSLLSHDAVSESRLPRIAAVSLGRPVKSERDSRGSGESRDAISASASSLSKTSTDTL